MNRVFISILHFNNDDQTNTCLSSLDQIDQQGLEVQILLIDNHSKSPFVLHKKKYPNISVQLIRTPENKGFAGGHNIGITQALNEDADYVVILNNDTVVDRHSIKRLIQRFDSDEIGIVSPKIYFTKGHEYHKDRYSENEKGKVFWYAGGIIDWKNVISSHRGVDEVDIGQYDNSVVTDFCTGACMVIPAAVLKKTHGFNEKYFLYYEDGDLNMRIKNAGYKLIYEPSAFIWHNNAGSSSSGSALQDYYISRNRMLFGMSYAPFRSKIALVKQSLIMLKNGREWQKKGIIDFYRRKFGRGSFVPK